MHACISAASCHRDLGLLFRGVRVDEAAELLRDLLPGQAAVLFRRRGITIAIAIIITIIIIIIIIIMIMFTITTTITIAITIILLLLL